jgi:5-methylcytosine-specific restriction endonuclease McrA
MGAICNVTARTKPCLVAGCQQYALNGASYCREHTRRRPELGLTGQRGTRGGWRRVRAQVIRRQNGLCACGRPATQVHHLGPPGDSRPEMLVGLCPACHNAAHGRETLV